ncbi:MAG TPA: hypothetical protein VNI55_10325 [Gaiellaceae bacterium]|nr:hypothetical protein [Gaiellaceae bacterium]
MRIAALTLFALAVLAAPACAGDGGGSSGITGLVLRGPTQPVCTVGVPCEEPAARATLAVTKAGRIVARVRTNAAGRFRVALAPGRYTVITTETRIGQMAPSRIVQVRRNGYASVTLRIDTGIR